jgi:protein SCO1/2
LGTRPDSEIQIGGSWQLRDINGRKFGSSSLEGHYYLLFFGTTLCPDVCPLTLMKMVKAQRSLNRSSEGKQFIQFQTVFVTVNPEADSA